MTDENQSGAVVHEMADARSSNGGGWHPEWRAIDWEHFYDKVGFAPRRLTG